MPTRKKVPARRTVRKARKTAATTSRVSTTATAVSKIATTQLKQLRKTVQQLKSRLQKENKARTSHMAVVSEAKKARNTLAQQMSALKQQGTTLSKELRRAFRDAERREAARQQALDKVAELRAELTRRTDELKRKSEQLAALARESASKAKEIIISESGEISGSAGAVEVVDVEIVQEGNAGDEKRNS